jgi:hypothetical protein
MRIVLATRALAGLGGSETYLLTVAEALERLGHSSVLVATELGEAAELARGRGLPVESSVDAVDVCDAALAQDAPAAYEVAERFAGIPVLFVCHSEEAALQSPPQLEGVCSAAVALSDRVAAHLRALAVVPAVERLHQPVDMSRFRPLSMTRKSSPRLVVAFGNALPGGREAVIRAACERAGWELELVGWARGRAATPHPERELARARVVVGIGRCAVEGMACGRAVYVYGRGGGDGWVTAEAYPALEADGFSGRATSMVVDPDRLTADLAAYEPAMGRIAGDLATANHDSIEHARGLIELWRRHGASSPPPEPAAELARLGRMQRQTEETAGAFALEANMWRLAAEEARAELDAVRRSRRYRIAAALARPVAAVRRWRRRRAGRVG